jgi:hypothetical protein
MLIIIIGKLFASIEFKLDFYPTNSVHSTLRNRAEMKSKQNVIDLLRLYCFVKNTALNERTFSEEWMGEYEEGSGRGFGSCVVANK